MSRSRFYAGSANVSALLLSNLQPKSMGACILRVENPVYCREASHVGHHFVQILEPSKMKRNHPEVD